MFKAITFLWIFVLFSCSAPKIVVNNNPTNNLIPKSSPTFLTKAEIFAELKQSSKGTYMAQPMTKEDKAREASLIDPKVFFSKTFKMTKSVRRRISFKGEASADLRPRGPAIKAQDDGKCTAFSGTAALESMANKDGTMPGIHLSEWDVWSKYQQYSCDAFIAALSKNKVCDSKYYPQYGTRSPDCTKTAYVKIADQTFIDGDVTKMMGALDKGNVVYIGLSTPMDIVQCKKVISPNSAVSSGGHAMLVEGYYKDNGEVIAIIRNSWGPDCGDAGWHYMPMSLCNKPSMYCTMWTIDGVEVSTHDTPVNPPPSPTCQKWKRVWYAPWSWTCDKWSV